MSSRSGPRADGSDGNDFMHRERVASQYVTSVKLKSKLKPYLYINVLLSALQAIYIGASHLNVVQDHDPLPWQYMFSASFITSVIGLTSLPRNKQMYLRLSNAGTVILGIGGMAFGMVHHQRDLRKFLKTGRTSADDDMIGGVLPKVLGLYGLFASMVLLYLITVHCAKSLIKSWDSKKSR